MRKFKIKTKRLPRPPSAHQEARAWERRMRTMGPGIPCRARMRHKDWAKAAGFQIQDERGGEEYIGLESGDALLKEDAS